MQSLKRHTSRQIINELQTQNKSWLLNQFSYYRKKHKTDSTYQVWQEGFHPQLILNEDMLLQKIDYVHLNPVKRGYVAQPEHWLYSSARNFVLGDDSIMEIDELPV